MDQALLHAVLAHGGVEDAELLNDGGDGVGLRVLVVLDTVGALPETRGLHAGDALQTLVLQHARNCMRASEEELLMSCSERLKVKHRRDVHRQVTDGGDEALLQDGDELVVDVDGQVADDLSVFRQVKVPQAVLLLPRRALLHELLFKSAKKKQRSHKQETVNTSVTLETFDEGQPTSSPLYCFRQLSSWYVLESQKDSSSKSLW